MRAMSKKTVAIFTSGEGHESIAAAAAESLQDNYKIKVFFEDIPFSKAYIALYQFFPGLNQIPYKAMGMSASSIYKITLLKYQKKINDFFAKHKPDALISTYGVYTSSLEELQNVTSVPLVNIVADPKTTYQLNISSQAKTNLVFDEKSTKFCKKHYPKANYQISGWFVRDRFEENYNQAQVRKKLGLNSDQLTFLIASGSEGTTIVMKVLPTLILSSKPVQVIVACGNNKSLFKSIEALNSFLDKSGKHNSLIPIKFTPDIHLYMQAADLVIGKAGPNMLFETIATETPFFAITHISGQEDGNLDIIREYKLGYVEENILKAQKLLRQILDKPEQLVKFKKNVLKMKKHNQQAKERLRKLIAKLI
jgi:UDP-N-acetylglucosamine:LPS N-acetylglucosamine transferase